MGLLAAAAAADLAQEFTADGYNGYDTRLVLRSSHKRMLGHDMSIALAQPGHASCMLAMLLEYRPGSL